MSRLIDATAAAPIDPAECLSLAEAAGADPRDEAAFAALGGVLASLAANRDFLAKTACRLLEQGGGEADGYGAQALLLAPPGNRFVLRASLWPGTADALLTDSGPAAFFYGVPHDHDFALLTCGYAGPGYLSDEWEVDPADVMGIEREPVSLRPLGRHRLSPGDVRLYRAHRDIHAQSPPERFSVSLNLLARDDAAPWLGQYRYDIDGNCIADALGTAPGAVLLDLAAHLSGDGGIGLVADIGARHEDPRMRIAAWRLLSRQAPAILPALLSRPDIAADRILSAHARAIAAEADQIA